MLLRLLVVAFVSGAALGTMSPLGGISGMGFEAEMGDPMAALQMDDSSYNSQFPGNGAINSITNDAINSNTNSVMDILIGSQKSTERHAIHNAISTQGRSHDKVSAHSGKHFSRHLQPSHEHYHAHRGHGHETHRSHHQEPRHHQEPHRHQESHHSHHASSHSKEHDFERQTVHHQPSRVHHKRHNSDSGPTQVADIIEELQVSDDGPVATKPSAVEHNHPDPHLRDRLVHESHHHHSSGSQSSHHESHHSSESTHKAPKKHASPAPELDDDGDEVPRDEFGLKKDCHWIQMDFTQSSDNCNQCMTVADAYFRGDEICVCYKNKPGSPMRTKCNEMTEKFKTSEDRIRELAVENQWNEYYKSYGLCEHFGHCGV